MREDDFYGDKFKWFVGVVKQKDSSNRVRVRVFGVHKMEDVTEVADEDLPWATVLLPTTSGETSASNQSVALDTGDWVMGFFADGDNCQQPVVIGTIGAGYASDSYSTNAGSTDGTADDTGGGGNGDNGGGGNGDNGGTSDGGNEGDPQQVPSVSNDAAPGNGNAEKIYFALRAEWLKRVGGDIERAHMLACAVMGNMQQESALIPNIQGVIPDRKTGRPEAAFGLIQWRDDRRTKLFKRVFGENLEPAVRQALDLGYGLLPDRVVRKQHFVTSQYPSIVDQVSYVFWEFDNYKGYHKKYLKAIAARDIATATHAIGEYIGPAVIERVRTTNAQRFDSTFRKYVR